MQERLGLDWPRHDAGDLTEVNVISSGLHDMRGVFDLMPAEGEEAVANIAARLAAVPEALAQWRRTLRPSGRRPGQRRAPAAARGGRAVRRLDRRRTATTSTPALAERAADRRRRAVLRADLPRGAEAATAATAGLGRFLRDELAPRGRDEGGGRPRAVRAGLAVLPGRQGRPGGDVRVGVRRAGPAGGGDARGRRPKIVPGGSIDDAVAALDADPARNIVGKEAFRDWMQALADKAVGELDGTHFDIPEPVRRIECWLAPTSDGGIYYTGPSEDFSRPGPDVVGGARGGHRVLHLARGHHRLPRGRSRATTCRSARPRSAAELLNRWQRLLCWCSGHGEGWALYAERLMDELGYLADPGDRLGMLDGQALRAARVIVDIGMHLELGIPRDNPFGFHPGERWTPELGWEFLRAHCRVPDENLRFEVEAVPGLAGAGAVVQDRRADLAAGPRATPRPARAPASTSRRSTGTR